jgi:hydroxymethylpyrimidine pyrophosphatase-like HAD family hydrolase
MNYKVLATDYDGTIATDGRVDEITLEALRRAKAAGGRIVLVTGRELADLFNTFEHPEIFERIVAENGAVMYDPTTKAVEQLGAAPPPSLIELLTAEQVPISVGHSIVATVEPHDHKVLSAIRDLGLEWHLIYNKGCVMALPADVTKASGLAPALAALGERVEGTIGVGDAENDQAFLRLCGLAVAVDNALPSVKAMADLVTRGARGAGVAELIGMWLAGDLDRFDRDPNKHAAATAH